MPRRRSATPATVTRSRDRRRCCSAAVSVTIAISVLVPRIALARLVGAREGSGRVTVHSTPVVVEEADAAQRRSRRVATAVERRRVLAPRAARGRGASFQAIAGGLRRSSRRTAASATWTFSQPCADLIEAGRRSRCRCRCRTRPGPPTPSRASMTSSPALPSSVSDPRPPVSVSLPNPPIRRFAASVPTSLTGARKSLSGADRLGHRRPRRRGGSRPPRRRRPGRRARSSPQARPRRSTRHRSRYRR